MCVCRFVYVCRCVCKCEELTHHSTAPGVPIELITGLAELGRVENVRLVDSLSVVLVTFRLVEDNPARRPWR